MLKENRVATQDKIDMKNRSGPWPREWIRDKTDRDRDFVQPGRLESNILIGGKVFEVSTFE